MAGPLSHILGTIEFQMSLLLFVSLAGYLLAARINQSAVIGEILVGLIIGPSLLGIITYTDFIEGLAHLGAVILLFVVGLEFKLRDIVNLKAGTVALFGILVPWIGGYLFARLFSFPSNVAVFVGTALTATSIAITANVLRDMGKLQSAVAKTIIGAAVLDDVLGLVVLSVSTNLALTGTVTSLMVAVVITKALVFIVVGIILGNILMGDILERIGRTAITKRYPEFMFIFALMVAFLYAALAEVIGLSAIIGSFIAGVTFVGIGLREDRHLREGAEYLHIVFASIFFVSLGILADLHALTPRIAWFALALTAVAVVTKLVGCGIPAFLQGHSRKDSLIVGLGMGPRGEVAMIVGLLGLTSGVISQDIYVVIVTMSILTTVFAPLVLRRLFADASRAPAAQPASSGSGRKEGGRGF